MKKIIAVTLVILLAAALGIFAGLYYIGNKIVDETIDEGISMLEDIGPELGDMDGDVSKSPAASEGSGTGTAKADNGQKNPLSAEKLNEVKKKITAQDKMTAAAIVMSKFSTGDIKELKDMLAGGLTEEEKEKAQKMALDKFTSEDIEKFKEMYNKYMLEK